MEIVKRNGNSEIYHSKKITDAVARAFSSVGQDAPQDVLTDITRAVENDILLLESQGTTIQVELIQDVVEKVLMNRGYYEVSKSYILYRESRMRKRASRKKLAEIFPTLLIDPVLKIVQRDYPQDEYSLDILYNKFFSFYKDDMPEADKLSMLIKAAVELTMQEAPRWEFIAARLLSHQFNHALDVQMEKFHINTLFEKISYLEGEDLYGRYILENYSRQEIDEAETFLDDSRNSLFTYSGLDLLLKRYVIKTRQHTPMESPQEMYLGIALHLGLPEKTDRMYWVKSFYDMLSKLQVTMATPTLSNARKPYHQLSSCFIDTVPDSLDGIYRSIDNFAQISKFGGGMGLYFGKVRAVGASIRGFEGSAGGVIRWIRLANDTAVAVDQLGVRQGALAVYLDIWHKDIPEFLQLRTNNGDDRMKAHDIFPAVCYPDLFWKMAKEDIEGIWYMMCPHEILKTKGYSLEDSYGDEWEKKYRDCIDDSRISKRAIPIKDLIRMILKSSVETGTPFTFNRDHVNRMNPNNHEGIIYSSNLCTEIAQNMSAIESVSKEIREVNGETVVVTITKPGDLVVCNLASLSLGNIDVENDEEIRKITRSAVRALDNVIDLNFYPIPYAQITNHKYRAVGLGVSGYHHMLAKHYIRWESEDHLAFADRVFERINFYAIQASSELAVEKGIYSYFEGSDWQTGEYFHKRGYNSAKWQQLQASVAANGLRNGYIMAVAPTSSTSILAGTTAGVDPIMSRYFLEEKKNSIVPRVAPELSPATFWYYKNAHTIDQTWVIRAAGVRQKHLDQSQSVNLYITNDYSLRQVLELLILAWEEKVKTLYYTRSKSLEVEECDVCSS